MATNHSTEIENHFAVFDSDMEAARAILDCAAVLTALERSAYQEPKPGTLQTGAGFANGHTLRDVSLPDMLKHAVGLLQMAHNEADVMREKAITALKELEQSKGGNNG